MWSDRKTVMKRREFIKSAGLGAFGIPSFGGVAAAGIQGGDATRAPNILVICSDQHRPGMTGYRKHPFLRSPHLDRLAGEGVSFTRAYGNCPVCGPSRMSFMTGKYTHQIGSWFNRVPLDPEEMTWARRLDIFRGTAD